MSGIKRLPVNAKRRNEVVGIHGRCENTVLFREYFSCGREKQNINTDTYIYLRIR